MSIKADIRKFEKMSSEEVDSLYKDNNVGGDKFKKKLDSLKERLDSLNDSAEQRLYNSVFGEENEEENQRKQTEKRELKRQIASLENYLLSEKLKVRNGGVKIPRIYPSLEIQNKIVESHLYLCDIYARAYYKKLDGAISYDDLFQTASLGLIYAAKYYIPSDIAKFSTYASKCIENQIINTYIKRKKKKINYDDVLFNLDKSLVYLDKLRRDKTGKILHDLRSVNDSLELLGMDKYVINRKGQSKENRKKLAYDFFMKSFNNAAKQVNISKGITLNDRDLISLELTQTKLSKDDKVYETLYRYIICYMRKLYNAILYRDAIREFISKDLFITDEEIIKFINKKIKDNKEKVYEKRLPSIGWLTTMSLSPKGVYTYVRLNPEEHEHYKGNVFARYHYESICERKKEDISWINFYSTDREIQYKILDRDGKKYIQRGYVFNLICKLYSPLIELVDPSLSELNIMKQFFKMKKKCIIFSDYNKFLDLALRNKEDFVLYDDFIRIYDAFKKAYSKYKDNSYIYDGKYINNMLSEYNRTSLISNKDIIQEIINKNRDTYKLEIFEKLNIKPWTTETLKETKDFCSIEEIVEKDILELDDERKLRDNRLSLEETVENTFFYNDYMDSLLELSEEERRVLKLWYDENGKHAYTAKEIGAILGIKPSKVNSIKTKALKKVSDNPRMLKYKGSFID